MMMKSIFTTLALSAAPLWLSGVFPSADADGATTRCGEKPACCKTISVSATTTNGKVVLCATGTGQDGDAPRAYFAWAGAPGGDSHATAIATQYVALAGDEAPDGAWLGVQIGEVPATLAVQLDLDGRGLVITNVVEDSPAEQAGLEPHDIVLSLDGQTVGGNASDLGRMIGEHKPGTEVTLSIFRNGKPQTLEVTLGSRPGQYTWRIDTEGEVLDLIEEDSFTSTGRIVLQGADGKWVVKNLSEIDELVDLGDDIKAILPQIGTTSRFVRMGDGNHTFQVHLNNNGQNINISRNDDGEVTVTRLDEDGEETTTVYGSDDELRDADEEAFSVYFRPHGTFSFGLDTDGLGDLRGLADLHVKLEGMKIDTEALHGRIQARVAEAQESAHDVLKGLHELHVQVDGTDFDWSEMLKNHGKWREHFDAGQNAFAFQIGKPRHTFEVQDDGSIEVRIRAGDSELLRRFDSEDDLADRNPRLFKKYEKLMEADQEE